MTTTTTYVVAADTTIDYPDRGARVPSMTTAITIEGENTPDARTKARAQAIAKWAKYGHRLTMGRVFIWRSRTETTQTWPDPDPDVARLAVDAAEAIDAMYQKWEQEGGISPDVRDAIATGAAAIGYDFTGIHIMVTGQGRLNELADRVHALMDDGAELEQVGAEIARTLTADPYAPRLP